MGERISSRCGEEFGGNLGVDASRDGFGAQRALRQRIENLGCSRLAMCALFRDQRERIAYGGRHGRDRGSSGPALRF